MKDKIPLFGTILFISLAIRLYLRRDREIIDYIGKTRRNGVYAKRDLSKIIEITQHHTATGTNWTPERIAKIHTDDNGWPGIGYHYLVYDDGKIFQVNDLRTVSYHNGVNNSQAIGIAWVGDGTKEKPSEKAIASMSFLYRKLRKELPNLKYLRAHNEKKQTKCPGPLMPMERLRSIAKLTR